MFKIRIIVWAFSALLLSGCALWQPSKQAPVPIEEGTTINWVEHVRQLTLMREWQIKGKIGIRTEDDGGSAYIDWSQSFDSFYILLSGPLGQGSTIISGNPFGARLQNAEGDFISESPEQLVLDHTGWEIPINHLLYWIKGIPAPFGQPTITYNQHGTVDTMEQDGWALMYDRYGVALNQTLPQRIKISKNGLKVTLVIKQWLPLTSEESDGEAP